MRIVHALLRETILSAMVDNRKPLSQYVAITYDAVLVLQEKVISLTDYTQSAVHARSVTAKLIFRQSVILDAM